MSSRADQYKASSSDCSRVSKHSTRQNKAPKAIQHKQASSNSTRQKQHSRRQPASTQSLQQFPGQVLHYRILPGFIPKGLSIVCPCNTKVSVFQFTYSCFRIILQEINSIQSSSNSMRRYSTLSSIQVILVAIPHKIHSNGYEYTRIRS